MVIKDFTNNNFVILAHLFDERNNDNVIKTTQDEVAETLNMSRVTVNRSFALLINNGYIYKDTKHIGRYVLTDLGCKIVEVIHCLSVEANTLKAKQMLDTKDIF